MSLTLEHPKRYLTLTSMQVKVTQAAFIDEIIVVRPEMVEEFKNQDGAIGTARGVR